MEPSDRSKLIGANIAVAIDALIGAHVELGLTPVDPIRVSRVRVVALENLQQARAKLEKIFADVVDGLEGQF